MTKKVIFLICILSMVFLNIPAVKTQDIHTTEGVDCSQCHECENPTKDNPCLKPCPRPFREKEVGKKLSPKESPEYVVLDELEDLYDPVRFSHKLHADMADMSGGCVECHHFTPTNQSHPPCKECHDPNVIHENIKQPGLKGAYHRQCMSCHCDWSQDTDCEVCHARKAKKEALGNDYEYHHYKPCKEPDIKIYETNYEAGAYVTFLHNYHSKFYGLKCNSCHREDPCVSCHYQREKPISVVEANADAMHHKCVACHNINQKDGCSKCHTKTERKEFDHEQATGWALGAYHKKLNCNCCHPSDKRITELNSSCNNCHSDWNYENFNHSITGIELDEIHAGAECSDCHVERKFDETPDCSICHEGDKTYPEDKPGKITNKGR